MFLRLGLTHLVVSLSFTAAVGQSTPTVVEGYWLDSQAILSQFGSPSLIHVRKVHTPPINAGEWVDEILVDESGFFQWQIIDLNEPTLFELSAPPWSWLVVVRPDEPAELRLSPSPLVAQSLTRTPGRASWIGAHPSVVLDSLARVHQSLSTSLSEPLMLRMSGVALVSQDSLISEWNRIQASYLDIWNWAEGEIKEDWARDLLWQDRLRWLANSGAKQHELDSIWARSDPGRPDKTWEDRLKSPGAFSAWSQVVGRWWLDSEVDWLAMNSSVFMANMDSLRTSMGISWMSKDMEEVAAAWLFKAIVEPDELVERVWETMPFTQSFREAYRGLEESRRMGRAGWKPAEVRLILPNGELDELSNQCLQPWKVVLIVKEGSSAANRERELFTEIQENSNRKDVCWLVASIDANEDAWRKSLSRRRSLEEETVWIGNNPQVFEDLGIYGVPQIVVMDPSGQLTRPFLLPSLGLEAQLKEGKGPR